MLNENDVAIIEALNSAVDDLARALERIAEPLGINIEPLLLASLSLTNTARKYVQHEQS